MAGNSWKSKLPQDRHRRVTLVNAIATKILEANGFVFFHFDGDTTWSNRAASTTETQMVEGISNSVRLRLQEKLKRSDVTAEMSRLVCVVPYYSIESWTYQSTPAAMALCQAKCGKCAALINTWGHNRRLLDEVSQPKNIVCFGSRHNAELSQTIPAQEVLEADASFAATAIRVLCCCELCARLDEDSRSPNYQPSP